MTAPVYHHEVLDSTNTEAFRLGEAGAEHLTAVVADFQTAGRGQPGHKWWMAPRQGVLLSVLFRKLPQGIEFENLTVNVGYALAQMLREMTGLEVTVEMPNDLMLAGRKIGGVLCEARWRGEELVYVVVGVGIDVNIQEFPDELRDRASSLAMALGSELDLEGVIEGTIQCLRNLGT